MGERLTNLIFYVILPFPLTPVLVSKRAILRTIYDKVCNQILVALLAFVAINMMARHHRSRVAALFTQLTQYLKIQYVTFIQCLVLYYSVDFTMKNCSLSLSYIFIHVYK